MALQEHKRAGSFGVFALPQPEPQPFGKYLLLDRIAAGGMAEIYRAKMNAAAGVTKSVVIKKILPHYAGNRNFVSMFVNEAKIAVGLSHGNIVQVFDFGEVDGEYFIAMELVHGQALSRVIRRAQQKGLASLPPAFAAFITAELCKGLHYAHTRLDDSGRPLNIVHRDVSPQNVILSYEGQVKIVDFGIAKARVAGQLETEAGAVKGKYTYFAPEQARGKELDGRTDVFAAGVLLYEMLCGRLPFEGKMIEVLTRIVKADFKPPRELNPRISPSLERIILKAMAQERNDRFSTAEAFGEDLTSELYSQVGTFGASNLSHFMMYLFEEELVAEGRPVQLPADFTDRFLKNQGPALVDPNEDTPLELVTAAARLSAKGKRQESEPSEPSEGKEPTLDDDSEVSRAHRGPPRWVFVVAPLLAAALAAAVVFLVGQLSTFSIRVTSSPPGASVRLDGQPAGLKTPLLISELSVNEAHVVDLELEGMNRERRVVSPVRGRTVDVHVPMRPVLKEPPPTAVALPEVPPVRDEVSGPGTYALHADRHTFPVPSTNSGRIRLDARQTYRVWVEGRAQLNTAAPPSLSAVAYIQQDDPSSAQERTVILSKKPLQVSGASTLYAFLLDDDVSDNSGSLRVHVQEKGARESLTFPIEAQKNAVVLAQSQRLRIQGLSASAHYELTLKDGETPSSLSPAGRPIQVLLWQLPADPKLPAETKVLSLKTPSLPLTGAHALWLTFPDDVIQGNAGTLTVELKETRPAPNPP